MTLPTEKVGVNVKQKQIVVSRFLLLEERKNRLDIHGIVNFWRIDAVVVVGRGGGGGGE